MTRDPNLTNLDVEASWLTVAPAELVDGDGGAV